MGIHPFRAFALKYTTTSMRYGAAYMLAALSGSTPTAADIERILSVGVECDSALAKQVVEAFGGRDVQTVVDEGMEKMGGLSLGGGGGGGAAPAGDAPAAEAPKAEEK